MQLHRLGSRKKRLQRVGVLFVSLIFVVGFLIFFRSFSSTFAATKTLTSSADFAEGEFSGTDATNKEGELRLQAAGSWTSRAWKTPNLALNDQSNIVSDGTYVYLRVSGDNEFLKYIPSENRWKKLKPAPSYAFPGANMVVLGNYIYASYGGYSKTFSKYSISDNTWTAVEDMPDLVYTGSSLSTDGTYIYALRGSSTSDFWRYNPSTDTWAVISSAPATMGAGASLYYKSGYLYTPRGLAQLTFYRYDIAANTWSTMANLTTGVTLGEDMRMDGNGDYIYVTRGQNTTTFYRYSISGNSWTAMTNLPQAARYVGAVYNAADGYLYVFRGAGTYDFWKYDIAGNSFVGPTDLPAAPSTGSDLINYGGYMYYLRGATTTNLYRMDLATNTWSALLAAAPATFADDTKAASAGAYMYFLRGSGTQTFYRYDPTGNAWATLTNTPATVGSGATLSYPGSGDYIYATRGGATPTLGFWRYSISGNTWDDAGAADLPDNAEAGIGSRLTSDGTDIYFIGGNGISQLLKYTVLSNTWSVLGSVPFSPYYGTDIAYHNGKIYAQAGFYKSDVWEYTIFSNIWRQLKQLQAAYPMNQGAWAGASLESTGGGGFFSTIGQSLLWMQQYTISAQSYETSGTWVSAVQDLTYVASWTSLVASTTTPGDTAVVLETRSSTDKTTWSSWETVSGGTIASSPRRYLQIRATLSASTDKTQAPLVSAIVVTYTGDAVAPTNPSSFSAVSQAVGGVGLTSGSTYGYVNPYMSWSGATDAATSVAGYYVYFGTNALADPEVDGAWQTAATYTITQPLSSETYYLRLKTKDAQGNVSAAVTGFTYVYSGIAVQNVTATSTADFSLGSVSNATVSGDAIRLLGKTGFWNQQRLTLVPATISYGAGWAHVASSNKLYTFRGGATNTFYEYDVATDVWTARANAPATVTTGGALAAGPSGYLFGLRGANTTTFWRYDIAANTWDDAAATDAPQAVNSGSSLFYDGTRYIYALKGNSDDTFMRYDTTTDSWDTLANTDFGATIEQITNNVGPGADLAYDGSNTIYAMQGSITGSGFYNTGFASYNITSNTWTTLPDLPATPTDEGAQIEYDSTSNAIYYIPAATKPFLFKYDFSTNAWTQLADGPLTFGAGASMKNIGGVLYILRGGASQQFFLYNISKASWKLPNMGLFGGLFRGSDVRTFSTGSYIVKGDGNYMYMTRGTVDNLFVRYDTTTGEAVKLADLPAGMTTGGSLGYESTNNKIYAVVSTYLRKLYVYDIATDTWAEESSDPPPLDPGAGSTLFYDGTRYMYWMRGANTTSFYRYDTQASSGARWSSALATLPATVSTGGDMTYLGGYIYALRGNSTASFYRYDTNANTWSDVAVADLPGTVMADGFVAKAGASSLFACRALNTATCYIYSVTANTWTATAAAPANMTAGADGAYDGSGKVFVITGAGTNTFADGVYSYVVASTGTSFEESGDFISGTHDLSSVYKYANLSVSYTAADNTTVETYTRSSADNSTWSSWTQATEEKQNGSIYTYKINSSVQQYLQVKFSFTSGDGVLSGSVSDYTINYYTDITAPTNPSSLLAYSSATQSASLTTNNWYNHTAPNFDWPEATASGGASDGVAGSGIAGYYVYFGTNAAADPQTAGALQTTTTYTAASLTSGNTYYLRVKAKDDAGNVAAAVWEPFTYKFDNEVPTNPITVVADPPGYSATNRYDFTWSNATDSASGIMDYCYKIGSAGTETCGVTTASASAITASSTGANTFYVRARDAAGNLATSFVNASYYYSSTAPSAPTSLAVNPETNTKNEFAFTWNPPSIYYGAQSGVRYYYSVNVLPTAQSVNSVGLSTTYLSTSSYATVPGLNTFYVVAKDEAGNIDYNNYASVTFTADTSAPGIPGDVEIADISVKALESWKLALSWEAPSASASGIASYKVYTSKVADASCTSNFSDFSHLASTTGKSYVDSELVQADHFYCVKACDSTGNCSAPSETVTMYPDGKWEAAPVLTASSSATVKTKSAIIAWSTDRAASSFVKYGKASGNYTSEAGSSTQVAAHSITLSGLDPGTTYYYKLLWADEDGNEGSSDERTFTTGAAPFLSNVAATSISLNTANISFTVSNASEVTVQYGETSSYGATTTIATSLSETTTSIPLGGLTEGTLYHYRLVAEDEEGNTFAGDDYTFETLPVPTVQNAKVQQVAGLPTATLRVLWTSNTPISTIVTYYPTANPSAANDYIALALTASHEVILKNLQNATAYTIVVKGKDAAGNEAVSTPISVTTAVDFRAPEILNLNVESIIVGVGTEARAQLIVSWDTDEPGTTQVAYAEGTGTTYNQSTQEESNLTTNHVVTITGLTPSKIYHLQALSDDTTGNTGKSFDTVVVTPKSTKAALNLVIDNLSKTFGFLKGFGGN